MTAIGNLNDYVKYQMAQGLEKERRRGSSRHRGGARRRLRPRAADDAAGIHRRRGGADGGARVDGLGSTRRARSA